MGSELVIVLGKAFIGVAKKFPDFDQKKVQTYEEKLYAYETEVNSDYPDARICGELYDWLLCHGKTSGFKAQG